eukprot:scaffold82805_cov49-Phaeocystis_antarctica.AAC.4
MAYAQARAGPGEGPVSGEDEENGCADWCSTYTCEKTECAECLEPDQLCAPPPMPWNFVCAEWCSRWTCEDDDCSGCGIEDGCKHPSHPPPPLRPPMLPSPPKLPPNEPPSLPPRCEKWCAAAPAGWDRKCQENFGSPKAACAVCTECIPNPSPPIPQPPAPLPWARPPKPPFAPLSRPAPLPPPAPLTSELTSHTSTPPTIGLRPEFITLLLVTAMLVGGLAWHYRRRWWQLWQRTAQRSHVGSIELTADPDDDARPAGRNAPRQYSMDGNEQDSDVLAQSILQQQVATALRIKQKLGKGLKRSGGAQLLSAQEPTDDFPDEVEPTDPSRVPPARVLTSDRTEEAKANDPSGSQLTELMSVAQLKAELHSRGIDTSLCLEKDELIRRMMQANIERARSADADGRVVV